ncbi:MAG: hypothetical protein IJY50_07400 [Clostridia bacterium]|nr:hypothetical protein [Clostridia bacterium]
MTHRTATTASATVPELIAAPQGLDTQEQAQILRAKRCRMLLINGNHPHAEALARAEARLSAFYRQVATAYPRHHLFFCAPTAKESAELPREELLRAHLRAALRLSDGHDLSLLSPILNTTEQLRYMAALTDQALHELCGEELPVDVTLQQGVRLATPAAVIGSRRLLEETDFALIDTDTLAALVFGLPAPSTALEQAIAADANVLLRLIEIAIGNAHVLHRFVILSGVAATHPLLRPHILAMGANALVLPPSLLSAVARQLHK